MTAPTTIFEAGDIVRVPFPHVERAVMVFRPAVVLTPQAIGPSGMLIWTVMITNAARDEWPGDVTIPDWEALGLLIPSKVRTAKVAPAEVATATRVGRLSRETWLEVRNLVGKHLGFS